MPVTQCERLFNSTIASWLAVIWLNRKPQPLSRLVNLHLLDSWVLFHHWFRTQVKEKHLITVSSLLSITPIFPRLSTTLPSLYSSYLLNGFAHHCFIFWTIPSNQLISASIPIHFQSIFMLHHINLFRAQFWCRESFMSVKLFL